MQTRYLYLLRFVLAMSDLLIVNICFIISLYLANRHSGHISTLNIHLNILLTSNFIWLLASSMSRLYSKSTILKLESIYKGTWKSVVFYESMFLGYVFFIDQTIFSRYFILSLFVLVAFAFLVSRFIGTALEEKLKHYFSIRKAVAVLGMNQGGYKLAAYLEQHKSFDFKGFLEDDSLYADEHGELVSVASTQFKTAAISGINEVYVSLTPDKMNDVKELMLEAEKYCVRLKFVPDFSNTVSPFKVDHMGGFSILSVRKEPLENVENRFQKRVFDVLFSSFVIVFLLSWLYPIIALIIKYQSPGPVLFKQLRSGRDNKPFYCYKFRSMKANHGIEHKQASKDDDRITPIGKFLRRTSLDELPQFFNVLLGNMSVMGPRPHMLEHTEQYRAIIDQYMVRQFLKPGISGWAQVNGFRGETKEHNLMKKRVEHDIWYMENWSVMLDVKILFLTILNMIKGEENAY